MTDSERPRLLKHSIAEHRVVDFSELIFDLILVFAITQITSLVREAHSAQGFLEAVVVFAITAWMWTAAVIQVSFGNMTVSKNRFVLFAAGLAAFAFACAIPTAAIRGALVFAGAYWTGRLVLLLGFARGR